MASSPSSVNRRPKRQGSGLENAYQGVKKRRGAGDLDNSNDQLASDGPSNTSIFFGVQNVQTQGGIYTAVGGDYVTINNIYYNLPQSRSQTRQRTQGDAKKNDQNTCSSVSSTMAPSLTCGNEENTQELFRQIQQALEFIKDLVEPASHPEGTCYGIFGDLCELKELVKVSALAYQACDSRTLVGRIMRGAIDDRILQCKAVVKSVHKDISTFLHQSLQPVPFCFSIVYGWWMGSEPKAIAAGQLALKVEARAFGEWLCDLSLFYWATRLFHGRNSNFSWQDLEEFIQSGPKLLKEIHVARIIIIEPLQGAALFIPIRFAESFEDVHRIVQFACHGTHGSRFIADRRYQLDESKTNVTIDPGQFRSFIKDGKAFEVTVLIKTTLLTTTDCPRCGIQNNQSADDNWIQCMKCHTFFNSRISEQATETSQSSLEEIVMNGDGSSNNFNASPGPTSHETSPLHLDDASNHDGVTSSMPVDPWTLFRRMRIEIPIDIDLTKIERDELPLSSDLVSSSLGLNGFFSGRTTNFLQLLLRKLPDLVDSNPIRIIFGLAKIAQELAEGMNGNMDAIEQHVVKTSTLLATLERALSLGDWDVTPDKNEAMNAFGVVTSEEIEKLIKIKQQGILRGFALQEDSKMAVFEIYTRIDEARKRLMIVMAA